MQRPTLSIRRYQRAAGLYVIDPARLTTRSAAVGAALVVGSALAFALDGPVAQAAYRQGLDPAAFGFWRACAGAVVLCGFLATQPRRGVLAALRRLPRAAVLRLALAAAAGLGLNLALFQAFARLPVAVAVAAFGCYPLFVAAWEAASRQRAAGAVRLGLATVAVAGLVLLTRPDPSVSVPAAGLLLALLAAVLHAAYILLGRDGWGEIGDGAATFMIVATAAAGLGTLLAVTRPAAVLVPVTDLRLTVLLLLEGALAGAAAPCCSWPACGESGQLRPRCCRCPNPSPPRCSPRSCSARCRPPRSCWGPRCWSAPASPSRRCAPDSQEPVPFGVGKKHHGPIFLGQPPVRLDRRSSNGRDEGGVMSQDRQWFVNTLRNLGYTEAADAAARELPDPVSMEELKKFADRYNISRDEVMSQMGGSP